MCAKISREITIGYVSVYMLKLFTYTYVVGGQPAAQSVLISKDELLVGAARVQCVRVLYSLAKKVSTRLD